jgi:hypothetical protein
MGWHPVTGERDPDYEDTGPPDLSVLHRWELLHMIWEPIALGAFGRVLSVLFRVLPPGRTLWMSYRAVAREAAVDLSTVVRAYQGFREAGVMVTASDGRPAIDYRVALDAAIRSITSRPPTDRHRRLARLHEIAEALGSAVNMDYIAQRVDQLNADPSQKLPGRHKRAHNPRRMQAAHGCMQGADTRMQAAHTRMQGADGVYATCIPELNTNGNLNWNPNGEINGSPKGAAARPLGEQRTPMSLRSEGFQATYAGSPTLASRVLDLLKVRVIISRKEVIDAFEVWPAEAGRALRLLTESGHAVRVAHGKYRLME